MSKDERRIQLAYSDIQPLMLDRESRSQKARKIAAVVQHFAGRERLDGLTVLDVGCSGGFVGEAFRTLGAHVLGVDIDIPALASARAEFPGLAVAQADSQALPVRSGSIDVVVCNHVYEHVVDPDALAAELHRVLRPDGIAYLGLGNRLGIMEPHHRLPFLSWLPPGMAHRYMQVAGKGDSYHERFRTRRGLRGLFSAFGIWDYTLAVVSEPALFQASDVVPGPAAHLPEWLLRGAMPLVPTFLWIGVKSERAPAGRPLRIAARRLR